MKARLGLAVTHLEDTFDIVKDGEKVKWYNREEYIAENHPNDWGWLALRLVDKVSRSCGYTPGKVTGQRVTVKAEMNGFTPGLDRHPPSH